MAEFNFGWDDSGKKLLFMEQVTVTQTGFQPSSEMRATPACIIAAGQAKPMKVCTSGWRPQTKPFDILDGNRWTELVRQFSDAVGFHLPSHIRDVQNTNDPEMRIKNSGRFSACHAEKKLSLFFLTQQIRDNALSLDEALRGKLRDLDLPLSARRATILLGHKPCKNCLDFLTFIRHRTGIDIHTQSCNVFDRHVKRRGFYASTENQNAGFRTATQLSEVSDDDDHSENTGAHGCRTWDEDDVSRSSRASSLSEDLVPLSAGNIRRTRNILDEDEDEGNDELEKLSPQEFEAQTESEHPPASSNRDYDRQESVFSTPSPSLPSSSLPSSSPVPRHLRFGLYLGSPPRIGGTGSPPAHWGPRGKPPPKPCFRPPTFWGGSDQNNGDGNNADRASMAAPSSRASSSMPSNANQASYFFGTPSPEADDRQAQEPRTTLRASVVRTTSPVDGGGRRPELQVIIRREPVQSGDMGPSPLPHPPRALQPRLPPLAPAREESADVEILGSRKRRAPNVSTGLPAAKRPKVDFQEEGDDDVQIYNPQQGWQPASATRTRQPMTRRNSVLVDLTAPVSADSPRPAFTRRPHPMPLLASTVNRPSRLREPATHQGRYSYRFRAATRPNTVASRSAFPDLQMYRYEV